MTFVFVLPVHWVGVAQLYRSKTFVFVDIIKPNETIVSLGWIQNIRALVLLAQHPEAGFARAGMDTYWASVRSVVSPPESLQVLWLVDPRRCAW